MDKKDIKTKPAVMPKSVNNMPKAAVKGKDTAVKDVKALMKNAAVKKAAEAKLEASDTAREPQKAETEAAERVESSAYTSADAAYIKSKAAIRNAIKKHNENKVKTIETGEDIPKKPETSTKTEQKPSLKTKDEYLKSQTEQVRPNEGRSKAVNIKTKENYVKNHSNGISEDNETTSAVKRTTNMRREYVKKKLKEKAEIEKAEINNGLHIENPVNSENKAQIMPKTRESYLREQRTVTSNAPKQNLNTVSRNNTKKMLKTKKSTFSAKSNVKTGSIYSKNYLKKRSSKTAKNAVKTQTEVTKKAAKEAAKQARQLAQRTMQTAKAATKQTAKIASRVAKAVAKIAAKLISALAAAGGVLVLVVVLIIVMIIGALAASPFGIFISKEVTDAGTIPLSQIIGECNSEMTNWVEGIELLVAHDDVEIIDNQADWNVILAVFAAKTAGAEDGTAEDVVVFDADKAEKLKEMFRNANSVNHTTETYTDGDGNTKTKLTITVTGKTKEELISEYSLSDKQKEAVETLLSDSETLSASSHSLAITDASVQAVVAGLPASLPQKRKDVVKNAASLVGKVNYFWGGKSSAIGWDSAWGTMQRVSAEGSPSSGTIRAYGLDCSGFVTWAFNNSGMGTAVGHGTLGQKAASVQVSASTVQAGDLGFNSGYTHVGIVVGRDTGGNILVIHCSSGANNVVLATASSVGFTIFRRPNCY